ncbi:MAG: FxsA family protein [Solirubrobacterales bacterium]
MAFLVVLFIVVPIAELYVIIKVGELIGLWPTLALLLADALLGSFLLKHQGRSAWRRFNEALAQRRFPGKEVADGALIIVGGTLLLAPGFLTDIVGVILLVPPTRAVVRRLLRRFTLGRFTVVGLGGIPGGGRGPTEPGEPGRPYDLDATAEEISDEDRHLRG